MDLAETLAEIVSTPERREQRAELQEERRAKLADKLPQTPAHFKFRHGISREIAARAVIATLPTGGSITEAFEHPAYRQLAEAYALQANFEEAALHSLDGPLRDEYEAKAEALRSLGVQRCACPPEIRIPDGSAHGRAEKTAQVIDEVFDGRQTILISKCRLCKTLSSRVGSVMPGILENHQKNAGKETLQ